MIYGFTDNILLPRLGKIHLGAPKDDKGHIGRPLDHFRCPPEVEQVYGPAPTVLNISLAHRTADKVCETHLKYYRSSTALYCRGDAVRASRLNEETGKWEGIDCPYKNCEFYDPKTKCGPKANLQFVLPNVPGLGVWQIDTPSPRSIKNVLSVLYLLQTVRPNLQGLKANLHLVQEEAQVEGKKKKVFVLRLISEKSMDELLAERLPPPRLLTHEDEPGEPTPDPSAEPGGETEDTPVGQADHWVSDMELGQLHQLMETKGFTDTCDMDDWLIKHYDLTIRHGVLGYIMVPKSQIKEIREAVTRLPMDRP